MIKLPQSLEKAAQGLTRLPGVGEKSAMRHVLAILKWSDQERELLSKALTSLNELTTCEQCGFYSDEIVCEICSSEWRKEQGILCVVENISDLMAIEKGGAYKGHYHILGGVLNPLIGVGPESLRIDELIQRLEKSDYQELILALNPSVEGDATCAYLANILKDKVSVHRIGFGIPIGGSLEYLDPLTISKALENKRIL